MAIAWAFMIIDFGAKDGTQAASSKSQEQGKAGFTTLSRIATGTFFLNIFLESSDIKALSWDAICSLVDVEKGDFEGDDFSDIIHT